MSSDKKSVESVPSLSKSKSSTKSDSEPEDESTKPLDERTAFNVTEYVEHLRQLGRRGLLEEYAEIVGRNPEGTMNVGKYRYNIWKNRYGDILCYDKTRVVLSMDDDDYDTSSTDYINASYVDGHKQKNAFIATQGPIPPTYSDFWKMIWEQMVVVIVMTTRAVERGRVKCGQYWPLVQGTTMNFSGFKVDNVEMDTRPDFIITRYRLTNLKSSETREGSHMQLLSWPDMGIPLDCGACLQFIKTMREEQSTRLLELGPKWEGHPLGPPIVVHCSAGIGRTGTFLTIDICIMRLQDQGLVNVHGTVAQIRSQRAYSIQVPEQYLFCNAAVIEYSLAKGLLTKEEISGIPDLMQEARDMSMERERELFMKAKERQLMMEENNPQQKDPPPRQVISEIRPGLPPSMMPKDKPPQNQKDKAPPATKDNKSPAAASPPPTGPGNAAKFPPPATNPTPQPQPPTNKDGNKTTQQQPQPPPPPPTKDKDNKDKDNKDKDNKDKDQRTPQDYRRNR